MFYIEIKICKCGFWNTLSSVKYGEILLMCDMAGGYFVWISDSIFQCRFSGYMAVNRAGSKQLV